MSARLFYVVDPMCSWCYGLAPALDSVRSQLRSNIPMELVMGGLAPDSDQPMDARTRGYVQAAWRSVESASGVPFNHDFWTHCKPRRSTYPACRAVIIARRSGLGWQMLQAIQNGYYLQARNPSDADTLIELAEGLGLDTHSFASELNSEETEAELQADFMQRRQLGASSFPSIGVSEGSSRGLFCSGYMSEAELLGHLKRAGYIS